MHDLLASFPAFIELLLKQDRTTQMAQHRLIGEPMFFL
jgi:hypothetical protein